MRRYIKYFIIIFILFFSVNVSAKTYGLVDNPDECSYDLCFTDLDQLLTEAEEDTSTVKINIKCTQSDFKIKSHEFKSVVAFYFYNHEYNIDGEGSTLKGANYFSFRSNKGNFYNISNINFISSPSSINVITYTVRRNNYDGGSIKAKLLMDYIGVSFSNPNSVNNITSSIVGESEHTRLPLAIINDYFLDDNDNRICSEVELNNITTKGGTITGIGLNAGCYNLNNYSSDFDISIIATFDTVVNVNNSTVRSLISSKGAVINVNSNNKWYQDKKIYFLNKDIANTGQIISNETTNYIVSNNEYNYIITDEEGTINIRDVKEEKIDLKNKRKINISELFPYLGNVNLNEEEWTSSNTDVATIDEGIITIKSTGETTFTTTPKDTQTVLEYKLIVTEQKNNPINNNPKTSNNLIVLVSSLLLLLTLVLLFKRNKKEF